jgi:hypothetical protein
MWGNELSVGKVNSVQNNGRTWKITIVLSMFQVLNATQCTFETLLILSIFSVFVVNNEDPRVSFIEVKEDANPGSGNTKESPPSPSMQQHGRVALRNLSRRVKSFRLNVDGMPKSSSSSSELRQCNQCAKVSDGEEM